MLQEYETQPVDRPFKLPLDHRRYFFMDDVTYFGQTDMGIKIFALYRKRLADGIVYQEQWMPGSSSWEVTTYLIRLITGGDCTLTEITIELAKSSFPEAF
jgi:hypothetical protein